AADAALATLDPTWETLVIGSTPPPIAEPDERASVTIVDRAADRLTLHYRTATQSLLRLAMPTYAGWHARLAGRELTTLTVDRAFIGVLVPSGEGDITLSYEPRWFWPGLAISSLALTACLIALSGGLSRPVGRAVRRAIRPAR
ncbi:MAG TPA: YfhO family protein, partial [Chloroflexota bacterium]